nr:FecR domain-containing protein [uncultured Carboxylicivirga sp.]
MLESKNKNILDKYMNDQTSSAEDKVVQSWLAENGDSTKVKNFVKDDWNNLIKTAGDEKPLNHILNRVYHTIRTNEAEKKPSITKRLFKGYSTVAATLFIPLLLGALSYLAYNELSDINEGDSLVKVLCPSGTKMAFTLPDGTTGMLNSDSYIEYPMPFNKKNRKVNISGEVYFEVFHDQNRPFSVHSTQSDITVLGTIFNIKAYPNDAVSEIVLAEGKISCLPANHQKAIILKPNEKLLIEDKSVKKSMVNADSYIAWKEGMLVFRGESMHEALNKLGRWYNVDIEVTDNEIWSYSFTGTFINDSLNEVLKLLKLTSPMDYKIIPRSKNEDGTWAKQKVLLFNNHRN